MPFYRGCVIQIYEFTNSPSPPLLLAPSPHQGGGAYRPPPPMD